MQVVHKYTLLPNGRVGKVTDDGWVESIVDLPAGAKSLAVHEQGGEIMLWCQCDPQASTVMRLFAVVPTGAPVPAWGEYVGTAFVGWTVWHVFEYPSIDG